MPNEKEGNTAPQEGEQINGPADEKSEEGKPAEGTETNDGTGEPVCRLDCTM